ncbi:S41 family peptidase [Mucilaginibacter pedocola]|uniref:Tail specific protease domain-containing protein n=1 Tax=Mucilaginibacter pedocola TaxID=1792845 RepID=A0A1S9PGF8_9SPHI|nr:S41 family peptidase [Mucilaginibacter pedocola]OOQ60026.1 hypothetical protein BC343_27240 [Mucilaginibacter pedocola]
MTQPVLSRSFKLLFLFLILSGTVHSQSITPTKGRYYYYKAWGFLKYYHPALASGRVDADSIFLTYLPDADKAKNAGQASAVISKMIAGLSKGQTFKPAPVKYTATEMTQNVDHNWFTKDAFLQAAVRSQLQYVYKHRFADTSHYYYTPRHFTTIIPHEKTYAFADTAAVPYAYRMLALAKIMAGVDYLFPHKYLMDTNWDKLAMAAIPLFAKADTRLAYETQLLKLVAPLNDTHALRFYKEMKNWKAILKVKFYPPFDYQLVENGSKIVVTKVLIPELCNQAGIEAGDMITHINGEPVKKRVSFIGEYLSASNPDALYARLNRYQDNLMFPTDSLHAKLTLMHAGATKQVNIEWTSKPDDFKKLSAYLNQKMAKPQGTELEYAAPGVTIFRADQTRRFLESIPEGKLETAMDSIFTLAGKQKGLILDMRSYPDWGGFYYLMFNAFGKDKSLFARYFMLDKQHIGMYKKITDTVEYYPPFTKPGKQTINAKVAILVNGETLSAAEYYTMLFQHMFPNSITIGNQSAGADGDDKGIMLPGGYEFPFSGNAIFYPDGTQAQRKGVKINKVVYPTITDLSKGEDIQLKQALEWIGGR